ncbi:MAG: acyl carrier protein [Shinella zoogloeoides]|uniref:acyl carrier protein n=1 Tax=Shinella zoogloeoides TaxID=352475 RepID=UPI003C76B61D
MSESAVKPAEIADKETLNREILALVKKEIQDQEIDLTMDTPTDAVAIDSIDIIHVVFNIEERYGCPIDPPSNLEPKTVGDIVNALSDVVLAFRQKAE